MPLRLVSFAGQYNAKKIELNWITESEQNTQSFSVEKSEDGGSFKPLAALPAKGTLVSRNHYHYTDTDITQRLNYYRLKISDKDGQTTYSETIAVSASVNETFNIFPNPARKEISVSRMSALAAAIITITDANGKIVKSKGMPAGTTIADVDITYLPAGMYSITLQTGFSKEVRQFLKK